MTVYTGATRRSAREYDREHLTKPPRMAVNVPWTRESAGDFVARLARLLPGKGTKMLVVSAGCHTLRHNALPSPVGPSVRPVDPLCCWHRLALEHVVMGQSRKQYGRVRELCPPGVPTLYACFVHVLALLHLTC